MNQSHDASSSLPHMDVRITKEDQLSAYKNLLKSEPFTSSCIGRTNPYSGEVIRSEGDYDLYLRERAFHIACETRYSVAANELVSRTRISLGNYYQQELNNSALSTDAKIKAEQIRLDELDRQRRLAFESEYRLRCQKTFALLAVLLVIICGIFSFNRYRKGYDAAEAVYAAESAAEYQKAYDLGYADGKNNYVSQDTSKKSSGRADAAYDSPIIGNKNTKKFHSSDCSYLPNKSNQKAFDSYEDAVAAGYDACGHCGGR